MSDTTCVSVIIPTYNRPQFLRRAVASVRKQKGVDVQIIIVDDGSDTNVNENFARNENVTYVRNLVNLGGGYARNRGLELAEGTYVNFLDDDDEFLENKLYKQVQKFNQSDVASLGMVSCHIRDLRSGEEIILQNKYKGDIHRISLGGYTVKLTSSMLFKTEVVRLIGGFDETLPSSQEYDLVIRLSKHYGVDFVDEVLAQANRSSHQISLNFDKKSAGAKLLFKKHNAEYRMNGLFFWLRMRLKLYVLCFRFWIGKHFGESAYKLLVPHKGP